MLMKANTNWFCFIFMKLLTTGVKWWIEKEKTKNSRIFVSCIGCDEAYVAEYTIYMCTRFEFLAELHVQLDIDIYLRRLNPWEFYSKHSDFVKFRKLFSKWEWIEESIYYSLLKSPFELVKNKMQNDCYANTKGKCNNILFRN